MTNPIFSLNDRGFNIQAFYVDGSHEAKVEIRKGGDMFREFEYPAYKIYNLAAHFSDIVDSILTPQV